METACILRNVCVRKIFGNIQCSSCWWQEEAQRNSVGQSQNKLSLGKFLNPSPFSKAGFFAFSITTEKGAPSAAGLGWDLEPEPGL